ncbi:MAG: M48 family metallopeptidase [Bacteroidota bacterium]
MNIKKLLFVLATVFIWACATVPVTNRQQLALISNDELIPLSFDNYNKVIEEGKLSTNEEQTAMIKRVGVRIQKAVEDYMAKNNNSDHISGFEWEFNLLEEDIANAWCMPGGKVAFYTGILPICENETGVAVVMGHEVAHAIANHGRERMSQQMALNGILSVGAATTQESQSKLDDIFLQAAGAASPLGMLKFGRNQESEADRMGLIFMAMAGYDPAASIEFWERMSAMSGGQEPPEFMSTHPSHDTRISDLKKWLEEAKQYYQE